MDGKRQTDKVIFRKFKDFNKEVVAMFPEVPSTIGKPHEFDSYMRVGGWGACTEYVIGITTPATEDECKAVKEDLEKMGFNLEIRKRITPKMRHIRETEYNRIMKG